MTDNEFDDIIKKKLQHHNGYVPEYMWPRIISDQKKRRGGYIWRRYFLALLVLISATGIYETFHGWNKTKPVENIRSVKDNQIQQSNETDTSLNNKNTAALVINESKEIAVPQKNIAAGISQTLFDFTHTVTNNNNGQPAGLKNEKKDSIIFNETKTNTMQQKKDTGTQQQNNTDANEDNLEKEENTDKFSLQFFASPDIPFSIIHSSNKNYETLLKNSISMKLSYTIGATISIAVSNRISLSTGIQYSRVNETISAKDSLLTTYNIKNHFSFINVPFLVSYKTPLTTSFQTAIKAGILLNISAKYKGMMPDEFGALTDISHNTYLSNTGVSFYTAINFSKNINNKTTVFAEPYFRWQTKNIADNLQPFTRKINTAGLGLGIQFKLFRDKKN